MAEKKSYTEHLIEIKTELIELKTISIYQENHLSNIDQHLNRLNERTNKNEIRAARNSEGINRLYWIIGGIGTLIAVGTPITLAVFGVIG